MNEGAGTDRVAEDAASPGSEAAGVVTQAKGVGTTAAVTLELVDTVEASVHAVRKVAPEA